MQSCEQKPMQCCPRCGQPNQCGIAAGQSACWCMQLPVLTQKQTETDASVCFCPACLAELTAAESGKQSGEAQQYNPKSAT